MILELNYNLTESSARLILACTRIDKWYSKYLWDIKKLNKGINLCDINIDSLKLSSAKHLEKLLCADVHLENVEYDNIKKCIMIKLTVTEHSTYRVDIELARLTFLGQLINIIFKRKYWARNNIHYSLGGYAELLRTYWDF